MSSGGRIKAAGLPLTMFTDPADAYLNHPNVVNAAMMTDAYFRLRKSPPDAVRDRFFPRDPSTHGMLKNGAALPRTSLTNHQGVGQFLAHQMGDSTKPGIPLRVDISYQTGFAIIEEHLKRHVNNIPFTPFSLYAKMQEVKTHFASGNLHEAQLAYERLIITGQQLGIEVQRTANVGREGFFFIHPSVPKVPAEIDPNTHNQMEQKGKQLIEAMEEIARQKRDEFAYKYGKVPPKTKGNFPPLYTQIDFLIKNDRTIQVSDVGLPDVGFFLTAINHEGNETMRKAQQTVAERLQNVVKSISIKGSEHQSNTICFITRKPVIENHEDTLEIKEIEVLRRVLEKEGYDTKVISEDTAVEMTPQELGILMNVDTSSIGFQNLLKKRIYDESVPIYPDPFLLLAQNELTELPQVAVSKTDIDLFKSVFTATEKASNVEKPAIQLAAVNELIRRTGLPDDCNIIHMLIPGQPTAIPFYRHDLRGLQIALNYATDSPTILMRGIPVNPDNAVLFDPDGKPVYTTFRYMFNQEI